MPPSPSFRLERDMLAPVCDKLLTALGLPSSEITLLPGPMIGQVIPDVLLAHWQPGASCYRGTVTHLEANVLSHIESARTLSIDQLLTKIFLPRERARLAFAKLLKMGVIDQVDDSQFTLSQSAQTEHLEIIAVELKLRRWREALLQGVAYRSFADRSYVVLDARQVNFSEVIFAEFERANVGLLVHDGTCLRPIIRCVSRSPSSTERFLASQKLKRCEGIAVSDRNTPANLEKLQATHLDA